MQPSAGIVIIGDEILAGKFTEENAAFLTRELRELGLPLSRIAVIPDQLEDIGTTVRTFSERFTHVFTSGGVGPTHDDLTMQGIAQGFGVTVEIHPDLAAKLRGYWGPGMPEANLRLAEIPRGAELLYGDDDRWPLVCFRNVYIFPGVPSLFRKKFLGIRERFRGHQLHEKRVIFVGDEGALAPYLGDADAAFPEVKIGSYPRFGEGDFHVIVTLESIDEEALCKACEQLHARLGDQLRDI